MELFGVKIPVRVVDRVEQGAALALYLWLVVRVWPEDGSFAAVAPALVLLSEGMVVLFLLIRRSSDQISVRAQDWLVALAGTLVPLLVVSVDREAINVKVGAFILLFGFFIQVWAKLSLQRSFGLVAANRGVRTGGPYRYVRHPMYFGYMIAHVGFVLVAPSLWNVGVYLASWVLLVLRVIAEERFLSQDEAYRRFMESTPYRLLPGVY